MNVNMICQGLEDMYPGACFVANEDRRTHGSTGNQSETINGLLSIITLSMQCLEIMTRHGYVRHGLDREGSIQDNDPYIEGLLSVMRKGIDGEG
jgi:hypothetical protein